MHETTGNFNNLIGMPQTLLELPREASFCVLELGMSVKGEIAALEAICKPNVRVITNVGLAHLEGVGGTIEGKGNSILQDFITSPSALAKF